MYKKQFVCSITTNRNPLRELTASDLNLPVSGNYVVLSDGTEYEILLHNQTDRAANVTITIDGKNIFGEDGSIRLWKNQKVYIERFVDRGNLNSGNRLKFIKSTAETAAYRGTKSEDGRVVVNVEYEKYVPKINNYCPPVSPFYPSPTRVLPYPFDENVERQIYGSDQAHSPDPLYAVNGVDHNFYSVESPRFDLDAGMTRERRITASSANATSIPKVAGGFTAPGAKSNQQFLECNDVFNGDGLPFTFELILLANEKNESITTRTKITCSSCGARHQASDKFCSKCGTSLELFS